MRIMYDSVTPADIPLTGSTMIGCYTDGSFENVVAAAQRFPGKQLVTIDVNGSNPKAMVLDYEPGDVQNPATAVQWAKDSLAAGNKYPTVYSDRSDYATVRAACISAGLVPGETVWFWIATLDMTWTQYQNVTGVAAVQYQDYEGLYDVSVVLADNWFPVVAPVPVPATHLNVDGWELPRPSADIVPAVISWYGDDGLVTRQSNIPILIWDQLEWSAK